MRIVLADPETPPPTWRERLPRPTWRWMGPVCVLVVMGWLLSQSGVSEIVPDQMHPPLRLAHPRPGAADWPGWRGPTQQGIVDESATPPWQWSPSGPFAWQTVVPGRGQASPCVWGEGVYLTATLPETQAVLLFKFDRDTGRLVWQTELCRASATSPNQDALCTPACDGRIVYVPIVEDGQVWLCAVETTGVLLWKRASGPFVSGKPYRASPAVYGSMVYVAVDHRGARWNLWRPVSTLTAFHRQTGEIVWRSLRPNADSAGIPVVAEIAGRGQLILAGRRAITSYDPESGAELWVCRWSADRVTGSIAYDDEHVYACAHHPDAETLCIRADGESDVTDTHVVWRERRSATEGPSPVVFGASLLLLSDQGLVTALDKTSGRLLWQRRLAGQFDASPAVVKSRMYCTSREGVTFVVDLDRRGELLAENPLGQPVAGSIAISGHRLIVRGDRHLLTIVPPERDIYASEPATPPRKF